MNVQAVAHRFGGGDRITWPMLALGAWMLLAALLIAPVEAATSEPAGRVIFSAGQVTAVNEDGFRRPLSRHDVVYPGERVDTGNRARVEIRMRDNALVSLDAESSFAVERYGYEDDGGSAIMSFLRGTLRTITGALGKGENETYQMVTPVATIGVRGTQYALQLCDDACAGPERPAGLYGYVDEGAISVTNEADSALMARGDYFHVADSETAARRLVRPPEGILDGGSSGDVAATSDATGSLLESGDDLLESGDDLLDTGGGLLDTGGSLLETGGGLLDTGGDLLDTGGGLLDDGGGLLDDGGGLISDTGDTLESTDTSLDGGGLLEEDTGDLLNTDGLL